MDLVQGHNAVTPVRLEPVAPRSRVSMFIEVSIVCRLLGMVLVLSLRMREMVTLL